MAVSKRGVEILSYQLIADLFNDRRMETLSWQHFTDKGAPQPVRDMLELGMLLFVPRDRHDRLRRMKTPAFRADRVAAQRPEMERIANRLIDELPTPVADMVEHFTHLYSIEVLCTHIGVPPEGIPEFARASVELVLLLAVPFEPGKERLGKAVQGLHDYTASMIEEQRSKSPEADEKWTLVGELIFQQGMDQTITNEELVWGIVELLFAGHDTTRFQLASCIRALIDNDMWEEVAADPALIPLVVEETLRWLPITAYTSRQLDQDIVIDGVRLPEGTVLAFNLAAATRDPTVFDDPHTFNPHREISGRVAFGRGLHHCLGHALARLEMEVGIELLTKRLRNPRIVADIELMPPSGGLLGPKSLMLSFDRD
jgi:cytochrome P450